MNFWKLIELIMQQKEIPQHSKNRKREIIRNNKEMAY